MLNAVGRKLLEVFLTDECNYDCKYCVAKDGMKDSHIKYYCNGAGENCSENCKHTYLYDGKLRLCGICVERITNARFLPWLDEHCPPTEWVLKLTGGEPGLYPEIYALIKELEKRGYIVVIQTNGSLPIPKAKNMVRVATWHTGRPMPAFYDEIVVIQGTDDWLSRARKLSEANIPYRITQLNETFKNKPPQGAGLPVNHFTHYAFMNLNGQVTNCHQELPPDISTPEAAAVDRCIKNMSPPPIFEFAKQCPVGVSCGNVKEVEFVLGL
ncbi:MAG: hypothetical protein FWC70_00395 [Defluviitaleaceae bacterium]|nr:hypothetical protein [Defluviitaleaceae bacterium]